MLEFLLTTLSITLGIVLASLISMIILFAMMCHPKVLITITKQYLKAVEKAADEMYDEDKEDEEL